MGAGYADLIATNRFLSSLTGPLAEVPHPDAVFVRGTAEVIDPLARTVAVQTSEGPA